MIVALVVALEHLPNLAAGQLPRSIATTNATANFPLLVRYPHPTLSLFRGSRSIRISPLRIHVEISIPFGRVPIRVH